MSGDEAATEAPLAPCGELAEDGHPAAGYADCLWYCFEQRGETRSKHEVMALSGESFRLFFNQQDPHLGLRIVAHNPLRAAASALGYDCEIAFHEHPESALYGLRQALASKPGPAIVHTGQDWTVITAGSETGASFTVWRPGEGQQVWSEEQLACAWSEEPGLLELGLLGYYFFVLGEKERVPDEKEAAMASLRRGVRLITRRTRVEGCAAGLEAYRELLQVLSRRRRRPSQRARDLYKYVLWKGEPYQYLRACRRSAIHYLEQVEPQFEGEEKEHLQQAVHYFRRSVDTLEALPELPEAMRDLLAQTPQGRYGERRLQIAVRRLWRARRGAQRGIRRLFHIEREAAEEMDRTVHTAERRLKEAREGQHA